jgi:hypothetical protein
MDVEAFATTFRPSWQTPVDPAEIKKEAQLIFDKYISETAESAINIDST